MANEPDERLLAGGSTPVAMTARRSYEADRLPGTSVIVRLNRAGGPQAVIDATEQRAPAGFVTVVASLGRAAPERIVSGDASTASPAVRETA